MTVILRLPYSTIPTEWGDKIDPPGWPEGDPKKLKRREKKNWAMWLNQCQIPKVIRGDLGSSQRSSEIECSDV